MNKEDRFRLILNRLVNEGSVQVSDLAESFNVSLVTIRKDLTELEESGKLYRSHGKAILIDPFTGNRSVNEKENLFPLEKNLIGKTAAKLIKQDDSILIASGTTMHAFARCITPQHHLTVVTASMPVAEILAQHENIDIILLGGILRHSSLSVIGNYSEAMLKDFSFTKLFIGVDGITPDVGLTTTDIREAQLNRAMMKVAQKVICLADSSKFGRNGLAKICDVDDVDLFITDKIPPKVQKLAEDHGLNIVTAEQESELSVDGNSKYNPQTINH